METKYIERAFHYADKNGNNYLNKHELHVAYLTLFGYKPSKFELDNIFSKYGRLNEARDDILIDKNNFLTLIFERCKFMDKYDEIREIFQSFDWKCKGFIDFDDFKRAILLKYPHMDDLKISRYFRELDTNGDDKVSFHDFVFMMENSKFELL